MKITSKQIEKAAHDAFLQVLNRHNCDCKGRTSAFLYALIRDGFMLGVKWYNDLLIQDDLQQQTKEKKGD